MSPIPRSIHRCLNGVIHQLDRLAARSVLAMGLEGDGTLLKDDQQANSVPRSRISLHLTIKSNKGEALTDFEEDFLSHWRH